MVNAFLFSDIIAILNPMISQITNTFGDVYSGSQKSEVCPTPYALCPMPSRTSSFARKAIYVASADSPRVDENDAEGI
jgi:hypothetical protein